MKLRTKRLMALATACLAAGAQAQSTFTDIFKSKTESKDVFLVYDLPEFPGSAEDLKKAVHLALTYQGDNAFVKDLLLSGEAPAVPGKMGFKPLGINLPIAAGIQIPVCEGASFTISSSDASMAKYGDSSQYMSCAFRYQGGYRVSFFAHMQSSSGGVGGLLSGKTLGKMLASAVGFNSNPMQFIESSLNKMEENFKTQNWSYAVVEMQPALKDKVVVADPLVQRQQAEQRRGSDKAKRMAARSELRGLGIDATDRLRFVKAIEASDVDVIELFLQAGALDLDETDDSGRKPLDYARKDSVRGLLRSVS